MYNRGYDLYRGIDISNIYCTQDLITIRSMAYSIYSKLLEVYC